MSPRLETFYFKWSEGICCKAQRVHEHSLNKIQHHFLRKNSWARQNLVSWHHIELVLVFSKISVLHLSLYDFLTELMGVLILHHVITQVCGELYQI